MYTRSLSVNYTHHSLVITTMSTTRAIARSPFDDTEANVVIRTCDNIDFYVYKDILKVASPFFRTLFSLPQPSHAQSSDNTNDELSPEGLPIVPVPEDSKALDYILRICYPLEDPERLTSVLIVENALVSSMKYEIDRAIRLLREDLARLGSSNPMQMYLLACRLNLESEAQVAADLLRKKYGKANLLPNGARFVLVAADIHSDDLEYGQLPAIHLYRLLRHICFEGGLSLSDVPPPELQNHIEDHSLSFSNVMEGHPTDILLQSSDGVLIPAHKVILRIASANPILSQAEANDCLRQDGIPIVALQHPAETLLRLIRACYFPFRSAHGHDGDDWHLFSVAQSYGMHDLANTIKSRWLTYAPLKHDPLSTYLVTSLDGWTDEAWHAARQLVSTTVDICAISVPEMYLAGTIGHYHTLLQSLHGIHQIENASLQTWKSFEPKYTECWYDSCYASTPSISPVVAFRALQMYRGISIYSSSNPGAVDPPTMTGKELAFGHRPAEFVRMMVSESDIFNQTRQTAILNVSFSFHSSPHKTRLIPYVS